MSILLKQTLVIPYKILSRSISCSATVHTKEWRAKSGLCINKNAEGPLTDRPDYTFLDGRPTPLLHKQKQRMMKQRGFASKIVELHEELDFALEREDKIIKSKEEKRQQILNNRLKPKGINLLNKSKF